MIKLFLYYMIKTACHAILNINQLQQLITGIICLLVFIYVFITCKNAYTVHIFFLFVYPD